MGEAGIGKSRLIREAQRRASNRGFKLLEGNCEEADGAVAFAGVASLLRSRLRQVSEGQLRAEFGEAAKALAALLPEVKMEELGGAPGRLEAGGPREAAPREAVCRAVSDWLVRRTERRPLLVTLEDIHWSDEASLSLLASLVEQLGSMKALFLLSLRTPHPDSRQEGLREKQLAQAGATLLHLQPLSRAEVELVMRNLALNNQPPPFYFLTHVYQVTRGNPLFVEELCRSSTATDKVSQETDLQGLHPRPQAAIPRNIGRIIRQRAQALNREATAIADLCAVHGRVFDLKLVQALLGLSERRIWQRCEELVAAHLAAEPAPGQFAFRHALVREALIGRLLVREQRAWHERLAIGLEMVYGDCLEAHLASLSYHSYKAGCWQRALIYCRMAAEKALALEAPRTAEVQLTRAIEAVNWLTEAPSWELHWLRAQAYRRLGDHDRALTDYATALDSARFVGDQRAEEQVLEELMAHLTALSTRETEPYYGRIVARAEEG